MKKCCKCQLYLYKSLFGYKKSTKDNLQTACRKCMSVYGKVARSANKDAIQNIRLKSRYKITLQDFRSMLEKQEYRCYICGKHQESLKKALCVDHDHATGEVRKLLCMPCNVILGNCNEDINILEKIKEYIYEHKKA